MSSVGDRLLHSIPEAAKQLSISPRVFERLIAAGEIETVKIGRRRLVPTDSLVEYIERVKAAS